MWLPIDGMGAGFSMTAAAKRLRREAGGWKGLMYFSTGQEPFDGDGPSQSSVSRRKKDVKGFTWRPTSLAKGTEDYVMVFSRQTKNYSLVCRRASWGWSGREDLNLRHPAPKAGALPGCATPRRDLCGRVALEECLSLW